MTRELPRLRSFHPRSLERDAVATSVDPATDPDRWGPFTRVAALAGVRSGVYFGLQTFIPAYFIAHFGSSTGVANAALTTLLTIAALPLTALALSPTLPRD